jgi:hypothetical protein
VDMKSARSLAPASHMTGGNAFESFWTKLDNFFRRLTSVFFFWRYHGTKNNPQTAI